MRSLIKFCGSFAVGLFNAFPGFGFAVARSLLLLTVRQARRKVFEIGAVRYFEEDVHQYFLNWFNQITMEINLKKCTFLDYQQMSSNVKMTNFIIKFTTFTFQLSV